MTGWLAKEFFEASPMLLLPILALVLFIGAFVAIAIRTARMPGGDVTGRANLVFGGEAGTQLETEQAGKERADG